MAASSTPIRRTLMRMIFISSGAVLAVTMTAFCGYEFLTFRQTSVQQLQILSQAIASNSTAALAFDNADDAAVVLEAFKADPHIVAAALYDVQGKAFATYPHGLAAARYPARPGAPGYTFGRTELIGFQPVAEGSRRLGTLFVESDLGAMYARIRLYALIVFLVIGISLPLVYVISRRLQHRLLHPILALADTTRAVSERHDYTVRAVRTGAYEFDLFTDTFNQMLTQIQLSEAKLHAQLGRLGLLQHITRATGERQDLQSIFQVVLDSLEQNLPMDFGCFLLHDAIAQSLTVDVIGVAGRQFADKLGCGECKFLKQLSEHVALATHQSRLYGALQQAYDDLRLSQHTVMQQERLRALGQMASGIAHDINNAISPVSLYTESLLEREPNLSARAAT